MLGWVVGYIQSRTTFTVTVTFVTFVTYNPIYPTQNGEWEGDDYDDDDDDDEWPI